MLKKHIYKVLLRRNWKRLLLCRQTLTTFGVTIRTVAPALPISNVVSVMRCNFYSVSTTVPNVSGFGENVQLGWTWSWLAIWCSLCSLTGTCDVAAAPKSFPEDTLLFRHCENKLNCTGDKWHIITYHSQWENNLLRINICLWLSDLLAACVFFFSMFTNISSHSPVMRIKSMFSLCVCG